MEPTKLTRKQVSELLDQVPATVLLGKEVSRELTPSQRRFALEVAKGAKGAEAYRRSYNVKTKNKKAHGDRASRLKRDDRISAEINAYKVAFEAAEYRTPAALRALVVQTLTQTLLDEGTPPSVKVQAARVLGTVTEVAAFTERKEITRVDGSAQARERLLEELRSMVSRTVDVEAREVDADALLRELSGAETHGGGATPDASATHQGDGHSIPHIPSENSPEPPTPSDTEDPPSDGTE